MPIKVVDIYRYDPTKPKTLAEYRIPGIVVIQTYNTHWVKVALWLAVVALILELLAYVY